MTTKLSLPQRSTLANPQACPQFHKGIEAALGLVCLSILEQVSAGTIDENDNSARLALACQSKSELDRVTDIITRMFAYGWDTVLGLADYTATYPADHETLAGEVIPVLDQIAKQLEDPDSQVSLNVVAAVADRIPKYAPLWLKSRGESPDSTVTHTAALTL